MSSTAYQPPPLIRGSSLYYALLFASPPERTAITLLVDFYQTLEKIVKHSSEAHIAKLKLNWWQEEIHATYQGQPRHPITQAMQRYIEQYALRQEWFLQIVHSLLLEVEGTSFANTQALLDYCCDNRGAFHLLIASISGGELDSFQQFAILSGVTCKLIALIRDFGLNYRQGKIFIPQSELTAQSLQATTLTADEHQLALRALLKQQSQLAQATYQQAISKLPSPSSTTPVALLALMNMAVVLLEEIQRENFEVVNQTYQLTPLRQWWIAWRTYHQAKKNKLFIIGSAHGKAST